MTAGRVAWAMRAVACAWLFVATGCTTIGLARMRPLPKEFAYTETLRLCVARDVNVSPAQVRSLVAAWNRGMGRTSGIVIELSRIEVAPRQRPGLDQGDVLLSRQAAYAASLPLGDGCDRWAYFAGRASLDYFSFALSAVGAPISFGVEKGRSIAVKASIVHPVQLWPWYRPSSVVQHEIAHLLGCPDHWALLSPFFTWWSIDECYEEMAGWKRLQMAYRDGQAARLAAVETKVIPDVSEATHPAEVEEIPDNSEAADAAEALAIPAVVVTSAAAETEAIPQLVAMRERERGKVESGSAAKRVKSRTQASAIALSEARRAGGKVPKRQSGKRGGYKRQVAEAKPPAQELVTIGP